MAKNIIFYFSDQQRYDTINIPTTPNLIRLQNEGFSFENNMTCQPVCGPARACLQSGQYASEILCHKNNIPLPQEIDSLAKILTRNGYDTAYIGKWHLASGGTAGNHQRTAVPEHLRGGYRYWRSADCLEHTSNGYGGYLFDENNNKITFEQNRADFINDLLLEYLQNNDRNKPFFAFISQLEPHHQNSTDDYECPKGYDKEFQNTPYPIDLVGLHGSYKKHYAKYLGCCKSLDENVGRLEKYLKDSGLWQDTIVIYTADHGCHFKTRNFEYKRSCHVGSLHTPLIMFGGGLPQQGIKFNGLTSLIDLPATILDIANIAIPSHFRGNSLFDYTSGKAKRDSVYVEISESQLGRAIVTEKYTYSVRKPFSLGLFHGKSKLYIEDKLYDNQLDKGQKTNLIKNKSYKNIKKELRKQLLAEIAKVNGHGTIIIPK